MNRWQKIARYNIVVTTVGILIFLLVITKLDFYENASAFSYVYLYCFPFALLPLGYIIYKKDKRDKVAMDERDHVIWRKAATAGSSVLAFYLLVMSLANFVIFGEKGSISPNMFFLIVIGGFILSTYARSIVTYLQYGREGKHE